MPFKVISFLLAFLLISTSIEAATTYDFSTRNQGINAFAYEGINSSALPVGNTFPSDEHISAEYSNIAANDGAVNSNETQTNNNYPMIRYVFELDENVVDINQLDFFWNGTSINENNGKDDGASLYIFNYDTNNYEEIATSGDTDTEVDLTHTISANFNEYIDEDNNNALTLLIVSNDGANGNKNNEINTDYISIEVESSAPNLTCEETGYTQVYGLNIDTTNLHNSIPYNVNNAASIADGSFDRIAYKVELQKTGEPSECVWVSMDTFTQDASLIGVPSFVGSNTSFQQTLSNMNVVSNKEEIVTGVGITTGNIEFWPYNYSRSNVNGIPSAVSNLFDTGDASSNGANYGSMQIHNHGANQTLFALNRFSGSTNKDLGIGNRPTSNPDWTFAGNSGQYVIKNINVYVSLKVVINEPVIDYRFDECIYTGQGNDVIDQISNANGSSNGLFSPVDESIINKSLDLSANNTSDWVGVPSSAVDGLDDFSVLVWFKTSENKSQQEIFHALGDSTGDDELEIYLKNNYSVMLKVKDNSQELVSSTELTDGNWHQLLITRENENACLFIDGTEQQCITTINTGALTVDNANAIVIGQEQDSFGGSFSTSQNFVGQLDEFKIFNFKLSDTEVGSIYQNESSGKNYDGSFRDATRCNNSCGLIPGELNAVGIRIGAGGNNTQINTTTEALAIHDSWLNAGSPSSGLIENNTYNIIASGSSNVDRIDFGGSSHDFSSTLPYPGAGVTGEDFLVHTSGTLSLPAGNYTIFVESDDGFSFIMNTLSGDTVSFNKFGGSSSPSNELRFENQTGNSNTGGSFTLNEDSVFEIAAIFFERGGGDYLEISISNDIRSNAAPSGYEILREGALGGKVKLGLCPDTSQIDHYQIIHDGNGLTCDAETVTINACTNTYDGSCTLSDKPVTLDINATGSSVITDSISFTGTGTASIPYTIAESTVLSINNASIVASNSVVCFDGSTTNCNLLFANAGFRFLNGSSGSSEVITNQIAGTSFPLRIEAVQNNNGVCEGLFTGNQNVKLSQENIVPSGIDGLSFSIDGNNIAKHTSSTSTTLNFETDSLATFPTPIYHDAGQIRLHASYDIGGVSLTGSSNAFWVSPAELVISAKSGAIDLNGASAASATTFVAGDNFALTVTAFNSLGVITPNYSPGQIQFKLERTGPTINGENGELTYGSGGFITSALSPSFDNVTLDSTAIAGVIGTSDAKYSEVGLLNLDVQDSNYGNVNIIVPATEINIGRFTPAYFEQTVTQGSLQANHGVSATCPSQNWVYSGQLDASSSSGIIEYEFKPLLIITPYNSDGVQTQNYIDTFDKLVPSSINLGSTPITHDLALTGDVSTDGTLNSLGYGVNEYTLSDTHRFTYTRNSLSEIAPFIANFEIHVDSIIDGDSIAIKPTDTEVTPNIAFFENPLFSEVLSNSLTVKFGRWSVENTYGPETENLSIPMSVEYWNGTKFITNTDDNCSAISTKNDEVALTDGSLRASSTEENVMTSLLKNGLSRLIELSAPEPEQGDINIEFIVPIWLKYDWPTSGTGDKTFDDNPKAIATFGVFRGNDRIISWREVGN